jgi:hypothetical protein
MLRLGTIIRSTTLSRMGLNFVIAHLLGDMPPEHETVAAFTPPERECLTRETRFDLIAPGIEEIGVA